MHRYNIHLDTTDCTLHVSSQSSMVSLQCPNSVCQLEVQNPQGAQNIDVCYSNAQSKYIICMYNQL
jgi:hypothetical protein